MTSKSDLETALGKRRTESAEAWSAYEPKEPLNGLNMVARDQYVGFLAGHLALEPWLVQAVGILAFDFDCGDNSCRFATKDKNGGMRTNGGCRCLEKHRIEITKLLLSARA